MLKTVESVYRWWSRAYFDIQECFPEREADGRQVRAAVEVSGGGKPVGLSWQGCSWGWRMNVERKYMRTRIHRFALGNTFGFLLLNLGWWGRWMDQLVLLYTSVNDDDQHQMCQAREREQRVQPTKEESICGMVNQEKETLDWPTPLWHKWHYLQPDSRLLKQLSSRILFVIYLHKLGAFSSVLPNKKLLSYRTKHLLTSGCYLEDEGLPHQKPCSTQWYLLAAAMGSGKTKFHSLFGGKWHALWLFVMSQAAFFSTEAALKHYFEFGVWRQ